MDGAAVTDMLLRAVAALRERGELPEMESPRIVVIHEEGPVGSTYHANISLALAEAQSATDGALTAERLAERLAEYLREVIEVVPAYHNVASIALAPDSSLVITVR